MLNTVMLMYYQLVPTGIIEFQTNKENIMIFVSLILEFPI